MRKINALIFSLLICSVTFSANFRSADWGDPIQKIRQYEKNKKLAARVFVDEKDIDGKNYKWRKKAYSFKEDIAYLGNFDVEYIFLKNKLIAGRYSQKIKDGDTENFYNLKKILTEKYGPAERSADKTSYVKYRGRMKSWYKKSYSWILDDTRVNLRLIGDKKFEAEYLTRDKKLLHFIKKNSLKKTKKIKKQNREIMNKF